MTDPNIPIPTAGVVKQTTTTETKILPANLFSRKVEDVGLLLCLVMFGLWMLSAVLKSAGYIIGPCKNLEAGFPWEFIVSGGTFAIPKILGRATAGKIWTTFSNRGNRSEPPAP